MRFGSFDITTVNHGYFRLDGGAMFGTVPKAIWAKLAPPDEDNRIRLAARSLLVHTADRVVLVDAGMGDRWPDKLRRIYDIKPAADGGKGLDPASVTDVILTHLHFDHSRGPDPRPGGELRDGQDPERPRAGQLHRGGHEAAGAGPAGPRRGLRRDRAGDPRPRHERPHPGPPVGRGPG
jgi:hypothetical protein